MRTNPKIFVTFWCQFGQNGAAVRQCRLNWYYKSETNWRTIGDNSARYLLCCFRCVLTPLG